MCGNDSVARVMALSLTTRRAEGSLSSRVAKIDYRLRLRDLRDSAVEDLLSLQLGSQGG